MRLKTVMTWDPRLRRVRLFRFLWTHGVVGDGRGYSAMLSITLQPRLFVFEREYFGWALTVLGLRLHHLKAFGGHIT